MVFDVLIVHYSSMLNYLGMSGLLCRITLLFLGGVVYNNFGKGLKEKGETSCESHEGSPSS